MLCGSDHRYCHCIHFSSDFTIVVCVNCLTCSRSFVRSLACFCYPSLCAFVFLAISGAFLKHLRLMPVVAFWGFTPWHLRQFPKQEKTTTVIAAAKRTRFSFFCVPHLHNRCQCSTPTYTQTHTYTHILTIVMLTLLVAMDLYLFLFVFVYFLLQFFRTLTLFPSLSLVCLLCPVRCLFLLVEIHSLYAIYTHFVSINMFLLYICSALSGNTAPVAKQNKTKRSKKLWKKNKKKWNPKIVLKRG